MKFRESRFDATTLVVSLIIAIAVIVIIVVVAQRLLRTAPLT